MGNFLNVLKYQYENVEIWKYGILKTSKIYNFNIFKLKCQNFLCQFNSNKITLMI